MGRPQRRQQVMDRCQPDRLGRPDTRTEVLSASGNLAGPGRDTEVGKTGRVRYRRYPHGYCRDAPALRQFSANHSLHPRLPSPSGYRYGHHGSPARSATRVQSQYGGHSQLHQ